jgi:hypothetical protein
VKFDDLEFVAWKVFSYENSASRHSRFTAVSYVSNKDLLCPSGKPAISDVAKGTACGG